MTPSAEHVHPRDPDGHPSSEVERLPLISPLEPGDPRQIGPYPLLGLLGRGGMGSVYLSQTAAGRRVAVKLIRAEFAGDARSLRLFDREAKLARRVARFCTAEVLDSGLDSGRPYLVTEYIDGLNLREVVDRGGPLEGAALERIAVAVATALTAIHDAGTVHRDLKPANILLSQAGPLVIDFGIAHALDGTSQPSRDGSGTPAFMAPEQARRGRVGPASDVFAWGGVVTYAATGRPPFGVGPPDALLYRVVHERPDLDGVPEPLRTIVEQAMDADPARRPTARQLYTQLLANPSAAHPTGPTHPAGPPPTLPAARRTPAPPPSKLPSASPTGHRETGRWRSAARVVGRRRRLLPALAAAVVLAVALPLLLLGDDPPGGDAVPDLDALSRRLAATALQVQGDQLGLARRLALAAYDTAPTLEARDSLYSLFAAATEPLSTRPGTSFAFSPDGALLATSDDPEFPGAVGLWNATAGDSTNPLAAFTGGSSLAFNRDSTLLATSAFDADLGGEGEVGLWDTATRGNPNPVAVLASRASAGGATGPVTLYEVAFSPVDPTLLATAGDDGAVRLWNTSDARIPGPVAPLVTLATPASPIETIGLVFSPDGTLLATSGGNGDVLLWDTSARGNVEPVATLTGIYGITAEFSPDGTVLATYSTDGAVRLWETTIRGKTNRPSATFVGPAIGESGTLAFSPDSTLLANGGFDSIHLWDATIRGTTDQPLATLTGQGAWYPEISFSPDSTLLAASGIRGESALLWNTNVRGKVEQPLAALTNQTEPSDYGAGVTFFSPTDTFLATGGAIWDLDPTALASHACADHANQIAADEWHQYLPELPNYDPPCD